MAGLSKSDQLRALREARANRKPNPFEDAARGRDPVAKEPEASGHNRPEGPKGAGHRGSSRLRAGRTAQDTERPSKAAPVALRKRGRPKVEGKRQWEQDGMSRRTWYRRQAEKRKAQ